MSDNGDNLVEVCGRLYDIIRQNMLAEGGSLEPRLPRRLFLDAMYGEPSGEFELDLRPVADADNADFFDYVFRKAFDVKPTEAVVEHWRPDIKGLPREDFRKRFLEVLRNTLLSDGRTLIIKG